MQLHRSSRGEGHILCAFLKGKPHREVQKKTVIGQHLPCFWGANSSRAASRLDVVLEGETWLAFDSAVLVLLPPANGWGHQNQNNLVSHNRLDQIHQRWRVPFKRGNKPFGGLRSQACFPLCTHKERENVHLSTKIGISRNSLWVP